MWLYIALGLLALGYYMYKSFNYDYWEKKGVPTASGCEWFFGHYKPMLLVKKHFTEYYDAMYREFPDAPMVGYYIMNIPALLIRDLDIVKTILVTEFSSFNSNGMIIDKKADILASAHPFVLKGDEWKNARNQVTPSLSLVKLKGYLPRFSQVGDEMVKYVKKQCVGTAELETREIALLYSTDVIGTAIYGIENNSYENKDSLILNITKEINFDTTVSDNLKMFFSKIPPLNLFFPARFSSKKLQDVMVTVTRKVVEQRLQTGEKRNDLLQMLLTQRENDTKGVYTYEYMAAQVFVVIIDMYETGSNMISALLYMLSRHPDIQDRLRSEIKEIKKRNNGDFTVEDIEGAKYLDMCYNEIFRHFSFFLSRECTADCHVPMPGSEPFKITKGTPIVIPITSIHMDPKYYPDPEKFDPERFTDEEVAKRPKFSFMPFGEGPKKCIGVRLVTLHIKSAIIKIIDNFKLTPSPKTKYPFVTDPKNAFAIRPTDGAWVIFEPIDK